MISEWGIQCETTTTIYPINIGHLQKWACQVVQWASLVAQRVKRLPAMQETWVWSLDQEDPLEKEMATHSSIFAWRILWTEKPGRLQSMGSQRVGHDWATSLHSRFIEAVRDSLGKTLRMSCYLRKITVFLFTIFSNDGKNLSWSEFHINKETNKPCLLLILKWYIQHRWW